MIKDELLAKIDYSIEWYAGDHRGFKGLEALRAVVELHKPTNGDFDDDRIWCERCDNFYPCETIQAIEEQLK